MVKEDKRVFVTEEGLQALKNEYKDLTERARPDISEKIRKARKLGDISENAEYLAAKEEQSFVEGRISELEEILKKSEVIKSSNSGVVQVGSKVKVHIEGVEEEFSIVGALEANPEKRRISDESPLGKALLGRKVGDKIKVDAPVGEINYTILEVS